MAWLMQTNPSVRSIAKEYIKYGSTMVVKTKAPHPHVEHQRSVTSGTVT